MPIDRSNFSGFNALGYLYVLSGHTKPSSSSSNSEVGSASDSTWHFVLGLHPCSKSFLNGSRGSAMKASS